MKKWTRILYQPNLPLDEKNGKRMTASKEHIALSLRAAEEGMVLLKNTKNDQGAGVLPLSKGSRVALFGKGSFDYVKGGGGSGDVFTKYERNLYEGLKKLDMVSVYEPLSDFYRQNVKEQYAGGAVPGMTVEPELPEDLLNGAQAFAEVAIITISRFSGEGWDRSSVEYDGEYNPWESETTMPKVSGKIFPDGDFYLTSREKKLIKDVESKFNKIVVVLNIGGIIDTTWIKTSDAISAALLAWQGGMEGGLAAAKILCGLSNPSGKLPDTFAASVDDYPSTANFHESPDYVDYTEDIYVGYRYFETLPGMAEKVCYPFGFGLSYTDFELSVTEYTEEENQIEIKVVVSNIGKRSGKETVQVYFQAPQGELGKPGRVLVAFEKTRELLPGESQLLILRFGKDQMASYDDLGKIAKSAYVLERGEYHFFVGDSVRDVMELADCMTLAEDTIVTQLSSKCAPSCLKERLLSDGRLEALLQTTPNDMNACAFEKMIPGYEEGIVPEVRARASYMLLKPLKPDAHMLIDVAEGKLGLDEFLSQLSEDELISLLGGQSNTGVANTWGFGNLPEYGVPNVMTADGPAGVRIHPDCGIATTAWPCATLLAATWNQELVEEVGAAGGAELKENNLAVWLTPAVNIHRNPLCGRNFEYYSEDPFLAGKTGAALVRGIQSNRVAACVKHFACNNKETNRKNSDSRVSERALREIYLKVFEIIVKEADPWAIMSAYNAINGHRCSENQQLLEGILRDEWQFKGVVTTDWWTRGEHYKEILAGNDIKMACGYPERVKKAMEMGEIDRSHLEQCAKRVLELMLKLD